VKLTCYNPCLLVIVYHIYHPMLKNSLEKLRYNIIVNK